MTGARRAPGEDGRRRRPDGRARRPVPRAVPALCLLLAWALAGCATIPDSGPVHEDDVRATGSSHVTLLAPDPVHGAAPDAIVSGFLRASNAGSDESFATARKFLARDAAGRWSPGPLQIYDTATTPVIEWDKESGYVTVQVRLIAHVDAEGRYSEGAPNRYTAKFLMHKDPTAEDQWRIADLNDEVLVSEQNFAAQYRQVSVVFPDMTGQRWIPDVRWYARTNLATSVAKAVLAGPSPWLRDAVGVPIPAGTALAKPLVQIEAGGVAVVDLTEQVLAADAPTRALIRSQFATALDLPDISEVRLTVGNVPLQIDALGFPLKRNIPALANLVYLSEDAVWSYDGSDPVLLPGLEKVKETAAAPALNHDGTRVVVRAGTQAIVSVPAQGEKAKTLYKGRDLLDPKFDIWGWVWTGEKNLGGPIVAVPPEGKAVTVSADLLDGRTPVAVVPSRDGTRIAVVSRDKSGTTIDVAAVVRDENGRPQSLGKGLAVGGRVVGVTAVAWADDTTLAVLAGADEATGMVPYLVPTGGMSEALMTQDGAVSIAAGSQGTRLIYLGTDAGELLARSGASWLRVEKVADARDPSCSG